MSYFWDRSKRDALARLTREQRIAVLRSEAEKTLARLARAKKPPPDKDDGKPATYEIDILALEMATGAPNWLSGNRAASSNPLSEKRKQEIRDKHRAKAKTQAPAK